MNIQVKNKAKKYKISQLTMIWLYPLIAIGGLWFPLLGYLMAVMMFVIIGLAYFKGRYWCGNYCPRGSFLDIVLKQFSFNKKMPKFVTNKLFKNIFLSIFMAVFIFRIASVWGNPLAIGGVFVTACVVTSLLAIPFGLVTKPRVWCAMCPMGTMQEKIYSLNKNK